MCCSIFRHFPHNSGADPPFVCDCCQILPLNVSWFTLEHEISPRRLTLSTQLLFHIFCSVCIQVTSIHTFILPGNQTFCFPTPKMHSSFLLQYLYSKYSLTGERDFGKIIHDCRTNWQLQS